MYTLTWTTDWRHTVEIDIHYCTESYYKSDAVKLATELQNTFGVKANLIPGRKGIFDVIVDSKMLFSKFQEGRIPETGEIAAKLKR